jgi:hypothetical protein
MSNGRICSSFSTLFGEKTLANVGEKIARPRAAIFPTELVDSTANPLGFL